MNFQYVYFIENHIKNSINNIYLSNNNNNEVRELEKVEEKSFDLDPRFIYAIYVFKIYISKNEMEEQTIEINLQDTNNNIFKSKIIINDLLRNIFYYDFKFDKNICLNKEIEPPMFINLTHIQQFEIYINYIRNNLKLNDNLSLDLIFSTQNLLIAPGQKYTFLFYLMILIECLNTKYLQRHLDIFIPEKIEKLKIFVKQ